MKINVSIKPGNQIEAFYLFFIIASAQIGVGIIGAPRFIFLAAERGTWLSIIIAFIYIFLVAACMFLILRQYDNADYFGIQVDVFGKWLGKLLGTILIIYFGLSFLSILLTYIEVIQLFLYHGMPNLLISTIIMILVLYTVFGGLRVVVGVSFLLFLITLSLFFILADSITKMNWYNLLPLFQTPLPDLLKGARATSYTLAGFEILMIVYPFIQNKKKVKLPVYLALAFTSLILLIICILSIGYFSAEGLRHIDWALLILVKNASFAFVDRLDYIVIVVWLMVVLPNLVLFMWAIGYGSKRLFHIPPQITFWVVAVIVLIVVNFFHYDHQITKFTDLVAKIGFWIIYVYPFLLLPFVLIKKRQKHKGGVSR